MSTLVEGRLAIRKYDDKDGNKRTAVEVVASDMQMLDSKGRTNGESSGSYAAAGRSSGGASSSPSSSSSSFDEEAKDDEIPF